MKIRTHEIKDYVLNLELAIDRNEFNIARHDAYLENTDKYPVMDKTPGLVSVPDLEMTYGPAVLFDEALELIIPRMLNQAVKDLKIRIMGHPQVHDLKFLPEGGINFKIKADVYPQVTLGQYKGIAVPYSRMERQLEFERAVVQKACENMKGEIPPHMIEQKVDSIVAQEKIKVNNDAVYHLLADMLVILDEAYKAAGAVRPKVQVRREAMDLMLQTASGEHEMDWREYLRAQVRNMAVRYHDLPDDFDARVDKIIADRDKAKSNMSPEELTEELFKAYLGSLELTEEQWRNQRQLEAARDVCMDMLLEAVADAEKLEVSADEVHRCIEEIATQANVEPEEAEANINKDPLIWKLRRDKALSFILNSAVTDEDGKEKLDQKREEARQKAIREAQGL